MIADGIAGSLAHPGGKITGVDGYAGEEIWGKLLQLLKETVPSVSKVAFLALRGWGVAKSKCFRMQANNCRSLSYRC